MTGSNRRSRGSTWWGAAVFGVLAMGAPGASPRAQGQATKAATAPAATPTVRVSVAESPAHLREIRSALSGMVAAIDPASGELRAPTAAEHEALTGSAAARSALASPAPVEVPGGGVMVLTSPANVDFLTAARDDDGRVRFRCTHGLDAASRTFARDHQTREVRR